MLPLRPENLLIYYGWLNAFNSTENQWNNEKVAQDMAIYNLVVFGDGVQDPSHGDFTNTQIIIPRLKELNPAIKIFGYVTANQDMANFKTKVNQWNNLEISGIFVDEAGYDYGIKREDFNTLIVHICSRSYAHRPFVNAWNIIHVLGVENDPNFPNSTFNPDENESLLPGEDHWYLLESFSVNTDSYTSTNGFASGSDWKTRGDKAVLYRDEYGISLASVGIINDYNTDGQELFDFSYYSALAYSLDANGVSDSFYGANSAKSRFWVRPKETFFIESEIPAPAQNKTISDAFICYGKEGKITIDFTAGNQSVSIEKW